MKSAMTVFSFPLGTTFNNGVILWKKQIALVGLVSSLLS